MAISEKKLEAPASLPTRSQPLSATENTEMGQREEWNKKNPPDEVVVARDLANIELTERKYRSTKAKFWKLGGDVRLQPHLSELPPAGRSVNHRHTTEAVIYIVKGEGYSLVGWTDDDIHRIDWKAGDMFSFPVWMWHQHFNTSETEPCRYLAVQDTFHLKSIGLHAIEKHPSRQ